jgi:hypothetical protein
MLCCLIRHFARNVACSGGSGGKELVAALSASGHLGGDGGADWALLTSRVACHFEHTVLDEPPNMPGMRARLAVTVWYPAQFAELRRVCLARCGGEDAFCASLSRCHRCARGAVRRPYVSCPSTASLGRRSSTPICCVPRLGKTAPIWCMTLLSGMGIGGSMLDTKQG